MPILAKSYVPILVERIFQKFEKGFEAQKKIESSASCTQFFVELEAIFGEELLKNTIRLLDTHTITIYYSATQFRAIAEITAVGSADVVKLFPGVNFCLCDHFSHYVLALPLTDYVTHWSADATITNIHAHRYSCKHVLGVRLAKLLHSPCLREEILPKHKFNFMLNKMLSTDVL